MYVSTWRIFSITHSVYVLTIFVLLVCDQNKNIIITCTTPVVFRIVCTGITNHHWTDPKDAVYVFYRIVFPCAKNGDNNNNTYVLQPKCCRYWFSWCVRTDFILWVLCVYFDMNYVINLRLCIIWFAGENGITSETHNDFSDCHTSRLKTNIRVTGAID